MIKLWKVTVNQWGWDKPEIMYAISKEKAEEIAKKYPVSDTVKYAGNFSDKNAYVLIRETELSMLYAGVLD